MRVKQRRRVLDVQAAGVVLDTEPQQVVVVAGLGERPGVLARWRERLLLLVAAAWLSGSRARAISKVNLGASVGVVSARALAPPSEIRHHVCDEPAVARPRRSVSTARTCAARCTVRSENPAAPISFLTPTDSCQSPSTSSASSAASAVSVFVAFGARTSAPLTSSATSTNTMREVTIGSPVSGSSIFGRITCSTRWRSTGCSRAQFAFRCATRRLSSSSPSSVTSTTLRQAFQNAIEFATLMYASVDGALFR